jgi:hypothetical protein
VKLTEQQITERRHLRFAKLFTAGVVLLFILSPGTMRYWPLIDWTMYSIGYSKIPKTVRRIDLRVLDTAGQWHSLRSMDLYTLDDDTSRQKPGRDLIDRSFSDNSEQRKIYRHYLVKQIEAILTIEVKTIQAWQSSWNVNFDVYPPFQIDRPDKVEEIGSFDANNYRVKQQGK